MQSRRSPVDIWTRVQRALRDVTAYHLRLSAPGTATGPAACWMLGLPRAALPEEHSVHEGVVIDCQVRSERYRLCRCRFRAYSWWICLQHRSNVPYTQPEQFLPGPRTLTVNLEPAMMVKVRSQIQPICLTGRLPGLPTSTPKLHRQGIYSPYVGL